MPRNTKDDFILKVNRRPDAEKQRAREAGNGSAKLEIWPRIGLYAAVCDSQIPNLTLNRKKNWHGAPL